MSDTQVRKSAQVSTTVSAETFKALEDHRWDVRKKMTEVVAEAVSDYITKHGIKVEGTEAPAGAEPAQAVKGK